jgi:hypothetical protein
MTREELSRLYCISTSNAHDALNELYEAVHDYNGNPIDDPAHVKSIKQSFIFKIRQELDLIQTACDEFSELL